MSIQLEDITEELHGQRDQRAAGQVEQSRHQIGVGNQLSELQADPRWSIYCDHIQALVKDYDLDIERSQQTLSGNEFLTPQKYGEVRVKLANAKGKAEGLRLSISLITALITRGEKAAQEMVALTKQGAEG